MENFKIPTIQTVRAIEIFTQSNFATGGHGLKLDLVMTAFPQVTQNCSTFLMSYDRRMLPVLGPDTSSIQYCNVSELTLIHLLSTQLVSYF